MTPSRRVRVSSAATFLLLAGCGASGDPDAGIRDGARSELDVSSDLDASDDVGAPAAADAALDGTEADAASVALRLPPVNGGLDYQLGGAYPPAAGVTIVSRDRLARPARGLYNVCYVNGFQSQPDESPFWLEDHPDLVLRDASGEPVIDPDWNELLLDVRTPDRRAMLSSIVGDWIEGCALAGFDAVEIDNLDTYSRSGGLITQAHAIAFMRLLSDRAHAVGLAVGQKNSVELSAHRGELGTDFAVAEECNRYRECEEYRAVYGDAVLVIEYNRADFDAGCTAYPNLSIVLRDVDLVSPSQPGYVYDGC